MIEHENNDLTTLTIWVKSLQENWHDYFPAQPRCPSLNRMTILHRRALLDRKINAPLALFNYCFWDKTCTMKKPVMHSMNT